MATNISNIQTGGGSAELVNSYYLATQTEWSMTRVVPDVGTIVVISMCSYDCNLNYGNVGASITGNYEILYRSGPHQYNYADQTAGKDYFLVVKKPKNESITVTMSCPRHLGMMCIHIIQ